MTGTDRATRQRRQLSLRLLGYILLVSSGVTLMLTAWQLWSDYHRDVSGIEERLAILEQTTLDPLTNSVWALNEDQINLLLAGMMNLEAVVAVDLETDQGRRYHFGTPDAEGGITRHYPLAYRNPRQSGQAYALGTLTVHASLEGVYARLFDRAANILVGQAIKTFIVSIFILVIVQHLVTRHLGTIADYARGLSLANLSQPLRLQRQRKPTDPPDELDRVETAINYMRETLIEDSAQREAAERRLQQSEARYRQLFESSSDGLALFDLDGRLLTANPAWLAMIGQSLDGARGLPADRITPPEWLATETAMTRQVLSRGHSDIYEKEYLHRDGHRLPVSVRSWVVRGEEGQPQFITSIVRDISSEKKLAAERAELEERLRASQRMETIGTLAGGIAHDLNNILTPIVMGVELLRSEVTDSDSRRVIETIALSAQRGAHLVKQVLSFARGVEGARVAVHLGHVVREIAALVQNTFPKNVSFQTHIPRDLWLVTGDPTQLNQVILNLCVNARDAMQGGGRLTVTASNITIDQQSAAMRRDVKPGRYVLVEVKDSGTGIPPELINRIFEPFFTTKEPGKGTGLGLSTVLGLVRGHGGFVEVESSPGKGTTFRVHLPAHTDSTAVESPPRAPASLPRGRGETVLVVDDEIAVRRITSSTLEAFGYRTLSAEDGTEAIGIYATNRDRVKVVITDIMMPLMDGIALAGALHRIDPKLPIVAASGINADGDAARAAAAGILHVLAKPFSAEALLGKIRSALDGVST